MKTTPKPPAGLSKAGRVLWKKIQAEYDIEDEAGLLILAAAMESHDRAREAKIALDRDGLTIKDRHGQVKPHPLIPAERDARAAMLHALKALNLDIEPLRDKPGRPAGR